MIKLLIVEDNDNLRPALRAGLTQTGEVSVIGAVSSGEDALAHCLGNPEAPPRVVLMDVQLSGRLSGIGAAVALRREFPRLPVVFYSIQDDDAHFRDFRNAGILTHYAYVRKSNYLLPAMIVPLLRDAIAGKSFVDPEIGVRVDAVRRKDEHNPLALLEPNEREVARMMAEGLSNEQIAQRMGFKDKRTIARVNGQIYAAWGLADTSTDEKVARTRATIVYHKGVLLRWDEHGVMHEVGGA